MDDLWRRIERLRGLSLRTMTAKEFYLVASEPDSEHTLTIIPKSTGKPRPIRRAEFERAYRLGLQGDELTPWRIRQGGASELNSSYVAVILRTIGAGRVTRDAPSP